MAPIFKISLYIEDLASSVYAKNPVFIVPERWIWYKAAALTHFGSEANGFFLNTHTYHHHVTGCLNRVFSVEGCCKGYVEA